MKREKVSSKEMACLLKTPRNRQMLFADMKHPDEELVLKLHSN
jgi:hypothetical protein